jgi:hypothetical protein
MSRDEKKTLQTRSEPAIAGNTGKITPYLKNEQISLFQIT